MPPRRPAEWTPEDRLLAYHAIARCARDADLDEDRAHELLAGLALDLDSFARAK